VSERFQKTFISVREFIESWDKEIYELTNLDFFIYLMINHLGNQIEKRFFIQERKNSPLNLPFESIGSLCFNLGDSFEFFVEENCFGTCSLNCLRDLDGVVNRDEYSNDNGTRKRISVLQAFLSSDLVKEQCLRVDLMNNVILDTLLHFYSEEVGYEIDETDMELLQFADFVENTMIDFIRHEGQTLLQRPADPAMEYFEELQETEEDYEHQDWIDESMEWYPEDSYENWENEYVDIETTVERYLEEVSYTTPNLLESTTHDISLFREYLTEFADVHEVYEINEQHFLEFFSYWLVQKFLLENEKQLPQIFRNIARFVTWLYNNYGIDYKNVFLSHYERVKKEVPRVINAMNDFLKEYDLFNALITKSKQDLPLMTGFYEIQGLQGRENKKLDLVDIHYFDQIRDVYLNSSAFLKLKAGDIIQATLVNKGDAWEVLEIQFIYPHVAKPFLH